MIAQTTRRGLVATAGAAIVAALVLVTLVYLVAIAVTDNLLVTPPGGDLAEELALATVLFSTVVGGLVGTAVAWAMSRFAPRPQRTFVLVCAVGLALYGIVPFTAAEQASTAVWLNLMHLSVALPVIGGLARYLPVKTA